MNNNNVT